jgi:hypothetical protein
MAKKKSRKTPTQPPENCASSTPIENSMANLSLGGVSVNSTPQPRLTRGNIVQEFDHYFGNATKLENWRRLCHDVGVADDLPSITQCKQVIVRTNQKTKNEADDYAL